MPTEEEIRRIIELYDNGNGLSQGQIAKELNRSKSTIHEWLKGLGLIDPNGSGERSQTKRATEAKATYDLARRRALNDKLFQKLEDAIDEGKITSGDLKNYCVSFGILEDKRQIIEPMQVDGTKTGLEEMREEIHKARHPDGVETSPS